jgi:hypothetical protein
MITSIEFKAFTNDKSVNPHPHLTSLQLIVKSTKAKAGVIFDSAPFETSNANKLIYQLEGIIEDLKDELNSGRL